MRKDKLEVIIRINDREIRYVLEYDPELLDRLTIGDLLDMEG